MNRRAFLALIPALALSPALVDRLLRKRCRDCGRLDGDVVIQDGFEECDDCHDVRYLAMLDRFYPPDPFAFSWGPILEASRASG